MPARATSGRDTPLLADPDVVAAALHPIRRRLLVELDSPASASELAQRIGMPRQKVNYHLRTLEDLGLVRLVQERPQRGLTERVMARCDESLAVDPAVLGALDEGSRRGVGGAFAAAIGLLRRAAAIGAAAGARSQAVAATTLDAQVRLPDPAALRGFTRELAELIARHDRPEEGAMRFRVTTVVLPEEEEESDDR